MSLPQYSKYKQSGHKWLGDIPSHWSVERLKRICSIFPSNVDKHSHDDEEAVRLCNYTDVYYNDQITCDMELMKATASQDQIEKFTLRAGDVIVTKDSETADDIAIAAYVPSHLPGVVCGYHLSMVRPKGSTSGLFVKRFFDSHFLKAQVETAATGLTRVGLGQYDLDNLEIAVPPAEEQLAIAKYIDQEIIKIDDLISEQERLIEILKEKRRVVISHAVTMGLNPAVAMQDSGVDFLGLVPLHWQVKRVKHLIQSLDQGWSPQCEAYPVESESEWGVLKAGCVNGGVFSPEENKTLPLDLTPIPTLGVAAGDLMISRANTRELVGSAAVALRDYPRLLLCDKLYRLRLVKSMCDPIFLSYFLGTNLVRAQIELGASGASSSMQNISQSTILELRIALPPLHEQHEIVAKITQDVTTANALIQEAGTAIDLLHERRAAVISAAVTGKIDVRGLA